MVCGLAASAVVKGEQFPPAVEETIEGEVLEVVGPQDDVGIYCGWSVHIPMPEGLHGHGVLFTEDVHVGVDQVGDPFKGVVLLDDLYWDLVVLVGDELQDEAFCGGVGLEGVSDEGFHSLRVHTLFPGQAMDAGNIVRVGWGEQQDLYSTVLVGYEAHVNKLVDVMGR